MLPVTPSLGCWLLSPSPIILTLKPPLGGQPSWPIFSHYFMVTTAKAHTRFHIPDQHSLFCKDQIEVSITFGCLPGIGAKRFYQETPDTCWTVGILLCFPSSECQGLSSP